jgi:hypothetical protein
MILAVDVLILLLHAALISIKKDKIIKRSNHANKLFAQTI